MGRRHAPRKLGSRKIRTNVLTNSDSVLNLEKPKIQTSKILIVHTVTAVKTNRNLKVITKRRNLPTIVSDGILKNHRVYLEREKSSAKTPNKEPNCEDRPADEQIQEDGNISDASTVLYEGSRSPESSPEFILGI